MSKRYPGGYLTASPVVPTATSAPGVWTLEQQYQAQGAGNWPAAANYQINKSLRFRSSASANLSRTGGTPTNGQKFTLSFWLKRGTLTTSSAQWFFTGGSATNVSLIGFPANADTLAVYQTDSVGQGQVTSAVLRDPSAWYHIVVAVDTTDGTNANRIKIYINNVLQTTSVSGTVTQNSTWGINSANQLYIGRYSGGNYLDGYLAEVNFIDGVAWTPSAFGTTDAYGIWQPIPFAGSYGTNGFYLPFGNVTTQVYAGSFSGSSQWVSVPNLSAFNVGTSNYTVEGWFYFNTISSQGLFGCDNGSGSTPKFLGLINSSGAVLLEFTNSGGATFLTSSSGVVTAGKWHHIAWVRNSGTSTIYVNGINVGSTATSVNLAGLTQAWNIGYIGEAGPSSLNGYASNFRLVTGTAVYTSNFVPPSSSLTAISGTQLLTLQNSTLIDNSSNAQTVTNTGGVTLGLQTPFAFPDLTADQSGNANNWTANNISLTSGATYDSMNDSPTNNSSTVANYCTLNPLTAWRTTKPANGNLEFTSGGTAAFATGTMTLPAGKWYCEVKILGGNNEHNIGFINLNSSLLSSFPSTSTIRSTNAFSIYTYDGKFYNNGTASSSLTTFAANDVIMLAYNADTSTIYVGKNGTWLNSSDPASGTGAVSTIAAAPLVIAAQYDTGDATGQQWNFGQQPFYYTAPTGFLPLNTYNLPNSNVMVGGQYMDATLYSGNGSTQTIANASGFAPDFVWIKGRNYADNHTLWNTIAGAQKSLSSDTTTAETTRTTALTAFTSTGFTLGADTITNYSAGTYVGWQWKGGSTGVSNTNGTITSTVSANPTAGFSVVTYTGTGSASTIGHGLGVAPAMVLVKSRSNNTGDGFVVYHKSLTSASYWLDLASTGAQSGPNSVVWNGTAPTSTVFSVGSATGTNTNTYTYVAYCFAPVAGYSAFGSYTGNASTDGPFVYTGFRPKFVLLKNAGATGGDWCIMDTSRSTYNLVNDDLFPNDSRAGGALGFYIDILSNGFKIRTTDTFSNASGQTVIYAAFAESPFKIARGR